MTRSNVFTIKDILEKPELISSYTYHVLNRGNSLDLMISTVNVNGIAATNPFNIRYNGKPFKHPSIRQRESAYSLIPQQLKQVGLDQMMIPFTNLNKNKTGFALIQLED